MSNVFNNHSKLWILDTDDILTNTPIWIRKVVFFATTDGGSVTFHSLKEETATPVLSLTNDTFTVNTGSSTVRINDDAGSALDDSLIAVADWAYIYDTETGLNDGWWYISGVDSGDDYIDVAIEANAHGAHALVSDSSKLYNIKIYNSAAEMVLTSDTIDGTASLGHDKFDWGPRGRWFKNLAMNSLTNGVAYIYIA